MVINAPNLLLLPEPRIGGQHTSQQDLALASEGVQRYLWQSAFGAMLIEVRDGTAFVNGARVATIAELRAAEV
jgi:hypothetical protein